jgi:hypothetical protein
MNDVKVMLIDEPRITFGYDQKAINPKDGLMLFGPFDNQKVFGVKTIGIIGPEYLRLKMKSYLFKMHGLIISPENSLSRPNFPGLETAFGVSINSKSIAEIEVDVNYIDKHLHNRDSSQRVFNLVNLYISQIQKYTEKEDMHIEMWFVVIPENIYLYGRPNSHIPTSEQNFTLGLTQKEQSSKQLDMFDQDKIDELKKAYQYEINFHNQLKARLLQSKIITQIVRESKIAYEDYLPAEKVKEERIFDADKAWNIASAFYYKLGGLPWKLGDIREGVCYLGIVFKKIDVQEKNANACCATQMFLNSGDGMVFRGNIGPWWNPYTKEFHLLKRDAFEIVSQSLSAYYEKFSHYPNELFIHARTYFNPVEWSGFEEATRGKSKITGVRINDRPVFKLYRQERYSVARGTMLQYGENKAYLWTKGFIPRIKNQLGLETPNPLDIVITHGDSNINTVCADILGLSKLNYNSCVYGDGLPVTLKFANLVGDILTAAKDLKTGILTFKHYI